MVFNELNEINFVKNFLKNLTYCILKKCQGRWNEWGEWGYNCQNVLQKKPLKHIFILSPQKKGVERHLNLGLFNLNPRLFNPIVQKFMVGKSGVEKFIVEKSGVERFGVEKSGVEMSFNQKKNFRHPCNFMFS